jgi:hypothetical protein
MSMWLTINKKLISNLDVIYQNLKYTLNNSDFEGPFVIQFENTKDLVLLSLNYPNAEKDFKLQWLYGTLLRKPTDLLLETIAIFLIHISHETKIFTHLKFLNQ